MCGHNITYIANLGKKPMNCGDEDNKRSVSKKWMKWKVIQ